MEGYIICLAINFMRVKVNDTVIYLHGSAVVKYVYLFKRIINWVNNTDKRRKMKSLREESI